jgi:hypothetical protein
MRIVKNIEEPIVEFESLAIGDVFLDQDDCVCMKIPKVYRDFSGGETESLLEGCMSAEDFYEHESNAYDLEEDKFFWLDDDDSVRPLRAHMEVK